jgi:HAMP domain-containing protein
VRPLQAAASVADRIAKGELQTPIPRKAASDETGALLGFDDGDAGQYPQP